MSTDFNRRYDTILLSVEDSIAIVSLNRPDDLNALNSKMYDDLLDVFSLLSGADEVRVIILTGEGRGFCAGGDIKEFSGLVDEKEFEKFMDRANDAARTMINYPKPVITAVHGAAVGAGASMMLYGDIVIAAENTTFMEAFGQVGLVPDMGGSYLLSRAVGRAKAKELIFTCKPVKGRELAELGLANYVVSKEELMDIAIRMARKVAESPALAVMLAKEMMNKSSESSLNDFLHLEKLNQTLCWKSDDGHEGMQAFLEKRKPVFNRNSTQN